MVKALLINHDADVAEAAEEDQVAKLELVGFRGHRHGRPIGSRGSTLKVQTNVLKGAPNKAGAIEGFRTRAVETIGRAQMRLHCCQQRSIKFSSQIERR